VRAAGVANTLWRDDDGWHADNTDIAAFRNALEEGVGDALGRARVLVIGAGGAARGVVAALAEATAGITIVNRTVAHAAAIAVEFELSAEAAQPLVALGKFAPGSFDIVVQTTSVGMEHGPSGDPSAGYTFAGTEFLFDVIYTPAETEFLRRGRAAGCRVSNGAGMFERQAELQFQRFAQLLD
jgi:shikimate 5-dehydrogenase